MFPPRNCLGLKALHSPILGSRAQRIIVLESFTQGVVDDTHFVPRIGYVIQVLSSAASFAGNS